MICEQGDIVSLNFSPSARHEPAGKHYGIVVSDWRANARSSLTYVVPVTSTDNGHPFHVKILDTSTIHGFAQCEALRSIDLEAREAAGRLELVGSIDTETLENILDMVLIILGQN